MKLLFVIKALGNEGGGAEKVLAQVASGLARRGHDIAILTSDAPSSEPFYALSDQIRLIRLGIGNTKQSSGFFETVRRMHSYRKLIKAEKPEVVIAFMHSTFVPLGIALVGSDIQVVASEHIGPEHYASRPVQRWLLHMVPLLTKRITVVSTQIHDSFGAWVRKSMVVVPNPVIVDQREDYRAKAPGGSKILLSVGRLAPQKDHKTLIDAFAKIASSHPNWVLRIVGEGHLREALESQIQRYGLDGQIQLPGAVSAIDAEYQAADLFVLSSTYESFGLATAEALLHRLPAIGFADCPGTNEMIVDGENGRLVSGSDRAGALAAMLSSLMADPAERVRLANTSRIALMQRFGIDGVIDQWESVLRDAIA